MSVDGRLSAMETELEAKMDVLTCKMLDWIETLDQGSQRSIWRLVPPATREVGMSMETALESTGGRLTPDDDDRTRAAAAWEQFPPRLLSAMEAINPGSTDELESWFCVSDA